MNVKQWMGYAFGSIAIEYGVCLTISFMLNDEREYWYAFLIMLGVWVVQIALSLKNLIISTISYHLYGKRTLISLLEDRMMQSGMPYFGEPDMDHREYLLAVFDDPNASRDEIRFAAESLGLLDYLKGNNMVQGWRMVKVYDLALKNYLRKLAAIERREARRRDPQFS